MENCSNLSVSALNYTRPAGGAVVGVPPHPQMQTGGAEVVGTGVVGGWVAGGAVVAGAAVVVGARGAIVVVVSQGR